MRQKVRTLLAAMARAFNKDVDDLMLSIYDEATAHLPEEAVCTGIKRCLMECKFWPPPAEIIERSSGTTKVDLEGEAAHAWMRVDEAVSRVGAYQTPDFTDAPDIARAIHLCGGWVALCHTDEDQWDWKRKEFVGHYCRVKQSGDKFPVELRSICGPASRIGDGVSPQLIEAAKRPGGPSGAPR